MPEIKCRLFNLLVALSLVLCIGTAVLWVRSIGQVSAVYWSRPTYTLELSGTDGVAGVLFTRDSTLRPSVAGQPLYGVTSWRNPLPPTWDRASVVSPSFNRWGFGFHLVETVGLPRGAWRFGGRKMLVAYAPFWLAAVMLAALPLVASVRFVRHRRRLGDPLKCAVCGHDLHASPDRCPECGAVPTDLKV